MFRIESLFYEIRATGIGRKTDKSPKEDFKTLPKNEPDFIAKFKTVPSSSQFNNPSLEDRKVSFFSPLHCQQYYGITEEFQAAPNSHGIYYLGAVMQQIIGHFAHGDVTLFKKLTVTCEKLNFFH